MVRWLAPGDPSGKTGEFTASTGRIVPAHMPDSTPVRGNTALSRSEREAARDLPPPPGHPRFPLLDPLRALAAISVLLVHAAILSGGFDYRFKELFGHLDIGVPFFFLLSGFLLYRPMLASRIIDLPAQRVRDYARNRFFRIFPLYWIVLTLTAIVPGMYGAFTGNWWVYFGLLQNFPVFTPEGTCAVDYFRCTIPPSWTLAMEVFFYLVLPFYVIGMAWLRTRFGRGGNGFFARWVVVELVVLLGLSVISFWIQSSPPGTDLHTWLFFSPLGRAWWFGLGMFLAVVSVRGQETGGLPFLARLARDNGAWFWLAAAGLYLAGTYVFFDPGPALAAPAGDSSQYLWQYGYFGLISLLVLAPAVFARSGRELASRVLAHPLLVRLGLVSYGIFLWHYPVMVLMIDLGIFDLAPGAKFIFLAGSTLIVSVLLSAITFRLVEKPLMNWSRSRSKRGTPAAG